MQKEIVIVSAARTPIGNFGGFFKNIPATELGAYAIKGALKRANLKSDAIQEVLMGCVLPAGLGQAPARQAALKAGLPNTTPCTTINKVCGSGMKSIMLAHDEIVAGSFQIVLAGGMENMSNAPYLIPHARYGYRLGHATMYDHMMLDGLEDAYDKGKAMGDFAEMCVDRYQFSREQLDNFAKRSLIRAKQANEDGSFQAEIEPVSIIENKQAKNIEHDEIPFKVSPEKISQLKPVFRADGKITAANASSISDGAAAIILMSSNEAETRKIKPLAKMIAHYSYAHEPAWFTTAPVNAIQGVLKKANWSLDEVDLFEINEAFSAVALVAIKDCGIDIEKVNIHGGATALGHPIGASGTRIVVTLLHALKKQNLRRGIAAICIGGGEATAIAVEIL